MKKNFLFLMLVAFSSLFIISCDDEEKTNPAVANLVLTADVLDNTVDFTATAENAVSYSWNFGNGTTGSGASAQATYAMIGEYWAKCTATGATSQLVDSIKVVINIGDPEVFNPVAKLLCGFDETTGESDAVWYWAAGKDVMLSGGAKTYYFEHDSAMYSIFDPIDQSWWNEAGPSMGESYNDAYSFKLNQSFDYSCDYKEDGLALNWAYGYHRYSIQTEMYSDVATLNAPKTGSWKITQYDFADYASYDSIHLAPKTMVDGVAEDKAYYLELTGGAWLFQENAEAKYQILSITSDSVFVRYPTDLHEDFDVNGSWILPDWGDPEWLSPGEGEWAYAYLVKEESTPPAK